MICRVIPELAIRNGRVVKSIGFKEPVDAGDPGEAVRFYAHEGADELIVLDISSGNLVTLVKRLRQETDLPLTVGGGITSLDQARDVLDAGADRILVNSAALRDFQLVEVMINTLGAGRVLIGVDAVPQSTMASGYEVLTDHGSRSTGKDLLEWVRALERAGVEKILLTAVERVGTRRGCDLAMIATVTDACDVQVIAKGGMSTIDQFIHAVEGADATAVAASAVFHNHELRIKDVKDALLKQGISIREE